MEEFNIDSFGDFDVESFIADALQHEGLLDGSLLDDPPSPENVENNGIVESGSEDAFIQDVQLNPAGPNVDWSVNGTSTFSETPSVALPPPALPGGKGIFESGYKRIPSDDSSSPSDSQSGSSMSSGSRSPETETEDILSKGTFEPESFPLSNGFARYDTQSEESISPVLSPASGGDSPPPSTGGKGIKMSYFCYECNRKYNDLYKYVAHRKSHKDMNKTCPICHKVYASKSGMRAHVRRLHAMCAPHSTRAPAPKAGRASRRAVPRERETEVYSPEPSKPVGYDSVHEPEVYDLDSNGSEFSPEFEPQENKTEEYEEEEELVNGHGYEQVTQETEYERNTQETENEINTQETNFETNLQNTGYETNTRRDGYEANTDETEYLENTQEAAYVDYTQEPKYEADTQQIEDVLQEQEPTFDMVAYQPPLDHRQVIEFDANQLQALRLAPYESVTISSNGVFELSSEEQLQTVIYISDATLPPTYISDATLPPTYISDATLPPTYISDANLPSTYISDANLPSTYISDATLPSTYISDATLPPTYIQWPTAETEGEPASDDAISTENIENYLNDGYESESDVPLIYFSSPKKGIDVNQILFNKLRTPKFQKSITYTGQKERNSGVHVEKHDLQKNARKISLKKSNPGRPQKPKTVPTRKEPAAKELNKGEKTIADEVTKYECKACQRTYKNKSQYLKHTEGHGNPNVTCRVCNKVYASASSLKTHSKLHQRRHRCKVCTMTYEKRRQLDNHMKKHEKETRANLDPIEELNVDQEEPVNEEVEEVQQVVTLNPSYIISKSKTRKVSDGDSSNKKKIVKNQVCDICEKRFDRVGDLKRHLIEHIVKDKLAQTPVVDGVMQLTCDICSKTFNQIDTFKADLREHAGLTLYNCCLCDKTFSNSSNFSKHKKVHGSGKYQCNTCNKTFFTLKMLKQHIKGHEETGTLQCHLCPRQFFNVSNLNKHIKIGHGNDSHFLCRFCDQKFGTAKAKFDHQWTVHGIKKSSTDCSYCGEKFRKASELKRHRKAYHAR